MISYPSGHALAGMLPVFAAFERNTLMVKMICGNAGQHAGSGDYCRQIAGFESQLKELEGVKCEKIFREQVSSVSVRAQFEAALEFVRESDVLVVTKLDRLARSVADLMRIIQALERKGAGLRVLNRGMNTSTPTGKLMLTVLGGIAQFEREMMLERQREGVAKARAVTNLTVRCYGISLIVQYALMDRMISTYCR